MKSYTVTLTSYQPYNLPSVLDHYFFFDPISGSNFVYPASADDSDFLYSSGQPTITADDGLFTPWGYLIQNVVTDIEVGPLKGPYTINFDPTGLDTSVLAILKIAYNFGDGSLELINSRNINPQYTFSQSESAGSPEKIVVSHDYYPRSNTDITVYTASITAYNSNIIRNIFNVTISSAPASIYDFDDIHLINNTQKTNKAETQNIFEIERPDYLTVARVVSAVDPNYPTVLPFDPNTLPGTNYNLVTWLDASDGATISKNSNNDILTWFDKSAYQNNYFGNNIGVDTPTFLYPRQSQSQRKSVHFTGGKYLYALSGPGFLGDTLFYQSYDLSKGFTVFTVAKFNQIGPRDTLFAYDLNTDEQYTSLTNLDNGNGENYIPYTNISLNGTVNSITVEQGDTSYYYKTSAAGGNYQPTTTGPISQNLNNYSLFSVTISGNDNAISYITADTAVIQRRNQNYQNSFVTLSSYLSGGFNPSTRLWPPSGAYIAPGTYDYWLVYGLLGSSDAYYDSYLTDAEISEFMIFNTPLPPESIAIVQNYLVNKWGLTLQTN